MKQCENCHRYFEGKSDLCSKRCVNYKKEHKCTFCSNKIYNSLDRFCSDEHKELWNKIGREPKSEKTCTKCNRIIKYFDFRFRQIGWKDVIGLLRLSYCRDCEDNFQKKRHLDKPYHRLYLLAKRWAKKENLPFNITSAYIKEIWPKDNLCPIFQEEFKWGIENKFLVPTLDKLIPKKGYVIGNVQIICHRANSLKSDISDPDIFLRIYESIKKKK